MTNEQASRLTSSLGPPFACFRRTHRRERERAIYSSELSRAIRRHCGRVARNKAPSVINISYCQYKAIWLGGREGGGTATRRDADARQCDFILHAQLSIVHVNWASVPRDVIAMLIARNRLPICQTLTSLQQSIHGDECGN